MKKVRVTNLIQGGLKAMEELEELEEDRRTGAVPLPNGTMAAVVFCKVMEVKRRA